QRKCSCGGSCASCSVAKEEKLQIARREPSASATSAGAAGGAVNSSAVPADSPGHALDAGTRAFMESRFGADFAPVRVHTDSRAAGSATALSADAYTTGNHIYFAEGRYDPASHGGR